MRSPKTIAADLRDLNETASRAFVPVNLGTALDLTLEWIEATTAALEAAGIVKPDAPADAPKA